MNKKKSTAKKVGTAAILGAAVGATAVVLSRKENREKITKKAKDLKHKGEKKVGDYGVKRKETAKKTIRPRTKRATGDVIGTAAEIDLGKKNK